MISSVCPVLLIFVTAAGIAPSAAIADAGPALQVDAAAGLTPISPYIYGINFAEEALARELRLPVRRWGGNATTRYNWKTNMSNRGSDWYFENLPENNATNLPQNSAVHTFIDQNVRTGTDSIITVPLIGWTPNLRSCGFSVAKYGPQQQVDPYWKDCGNGIKSDGTTKLTGNDPLDTSLAIGPEFVREWIQYLAGRYGTAAKGGVRFYNLDNEPMLWNSTHRDAHPSPTSYDEMRDRTYAYAAAIKQADPSALTLGPVLWGWVAYFRSALDTASDQWWNLHPTPDQGAHGGIPFLDWYLQQMRDYEAKNGTRILDYLDLHFYPQGTGVSDNSAGNASTQALRLRSTRALWDPDYIDESWINDKVRLIPRMRDWVQNNYPGTKIALTEYNWGAMKTLNGALAQADVLGIFGREKLDVATLWGPDASDQPWAYAFRMYRNYDEAGASFGDISVRASSSDSDKLSIFAARRISDSALTVMLINKSSADLASTVSLSGFAPAGPARVYRYSSDNLKAIARVADQPVTAAGFSATFPASSISLMVLPAAPAALVTQVFAHVVAGPGASTVFTVTNTGDSAASSTLTLIDQAGAPLRVTMADSGSGTSVGSSFQFQLPPGGMRVLTATSSDQDIQSGWAKIDSSGGSTNGVATFQFTQGSTPSTLAGVLASQPVGAAVIPINNDDANARYAGFAIANPGAANVNITITVRTEDGSSTIAPIRHAELNPLKPQTQIARFLHQYASSLVNFRGSMTLSAGAGETFAVVALNQDRGLYTAVPVINQKSAWNLAWSDEFNQADNTGPDPAKWVMETGNNNGWGNAEREYYTNRLDNAYIQNGALVIQAKSESYSGYSYTSARLKTQGKFSHKYGRVEARIMIPGTQGIWPAFWMLGDDITTVGWPACGEIDIMENIGKEPSIVHGTLHGPGYSGGNGIGALYALPGGGKFMDDFHVYAIEWESDQIRWYVDGALYKTVKSTDIPSGTRWVFDHNFFILLNVAVGGSWPGYPDATTIFPQKMLVDYVRVYEKIQ